jgi:hypothetical protein
MIWLVKSKYLFLGIFSLLNLILAVSCSSGSALSTANSTTSEIAVYLSDTHSGVL